MNLYIQRIQRKPGKIANKFALIKKQNGGIYMRVKKITKMIAMLTAIACVGATLPAGQVQAEEAVRSVYTNEEQTHFNNDANGSGSTAFLWNQ